MFESSSLRLVPHVSLNDFFSVLYIDTVDPLRIGRYYVPTIMRICPSASSGNGIACVPMQCRVKKEARVNFFRLGDLEESILRGPGRSAHREQQHTVP